MYPAKLSASAACAIVLLFMASPLHARDQQEARTRFEEMDARHRWKEAFFDEGTGTWETGSWKNGKWQEKWFLDGEIASVENEPKGMHLRAGPRFRDDAHHMVLWTKESFSGDVKIEYEFTRTDFENLCVMIIYIQATGCGEGPYDEDIYQWADLRKVPAMSTYYRNMNAYHISYAAYGLLDTEEQKDYIRARRYLPENDHLKGSELKPEYSDTGLFKPGVPYRMTIIKEAREMVMRVEGPDKTSYFYFSNPDLPPVVRGRIGLRQMYTRSALYRNFRISTDN